MSNAEPIGVAFVEIEPIAPGFRAKTEAQIRGQIAAVQTKAAATTRAAGAQQALTRAEVAGAGAAASNAQAENAAAAATSRHTLASTQATAALSRQSIAQQALNTSTLGMHPAMLAAAVGAGVFFKSLSLAADFEEQMKLIEAATGATEDELERAGDRARDLGADLRLPLTSAREGAEAINLLVRSGFDLEGAMDAAGGALLTAAASGETVADSVSITDQILDAFNLRADESVRVANALAVGMRFTGGSAQEAGRGLATLAPIADSLGLSLEEVNTLVLQLAESGIELSRGSGVLRQSLLRISTPSVAKALNEVGVGMNVLLDAQGNLRPDAFARLAEALSDLSDAEQRRVLTQAFGARGALAVIRLVEQQRTGYDRMASSVRDASAAQREAEARSEGLRGQLAETSATVEDVGTNFGRVATGPATLYLRQIEEIARATDNLIFVGAGVAGLIGDIGDAFEDAVPGGDRFLGVLGRIGVAQAFPVVGIATGINTIVGHFRRGEEEGGNAIEGFRKRVDAALQGMVADLKKAARDIGVETGQIGGSLSVEIAAASVSGNQQQQLSLLREQEANQLNLFNRLLETARKRPSPEHDAAVDRARAQLEATRNAIQAILNERQATIDASTAEAAAQATKLEQAADERDREFVRALQAGLTQREARVSVAASTDETLRDDVQANVALRRFLADTIDAIRERIRDARAAGRETQGLVEALANFRRQRNQVKREIDALREQQAEQAAATRVERAEIDLQILETRVGDDPTETQRGALVSAHQRVIKALQAQQKLVGRRSVEWKRLQLQIAQEQAAIRDLRKRQDDRNKAAETASRQQFDFMRTMTGFAFNLTGNLIPGFASAGLVGGTSGTTGTVAGTVTDLGDERHPVELGRPAPSTRPAGIPSPTKPVSTAQGNTQIDLLRKIHSELRRSNAGTEHPEASGQRRRGSASGDFSYQGSHGL